MSRNHLIDALKVLASQLIVVHHLAAYGPLSDVWDAAATASSDWFFEYGRMAVQIFLVTGGYLAAQGIAGKMSPRCFNVFVVVLNRYLRLAPPLVAALAIAIPSAMLARHWSSFQFFPASPTWDQVLAHALLIQTLTGHDSLSAGVWYVAIDFQLFILINALALLGPTWLRLAEVGLTLASLFVFNLIPALDTWSIYFFGAYGLGATAYWVGGSKRPVRTLCGLLLIGVFALLVDFRERIALAVCTAIVLGIEQASRQWRRHFHPNSPGIFVPLAWLADRSYALFLVHFSLVMIGNSWYARSGSTSSLDGALVILGCWLLSQVLAIGFHKWVARPLSRLRS